MINRRNCLRLLLIGINHHLRSRHCRRVCSMAAVASAFSVNCKDLLHYFSVQKSSFAVEFSRNGSGGGRSIGLGVKGCCSSENTCSKNSISIKGSGFCNHNAVGSGFELHKARATSPCLRRQLSKLPELVPEEITLSLENRFGSDGGEESNTDGACQNDRGSSLKSAGDRSLSEKIVVAVDVDEVLGNFVSALNEFIADRYSLNHSVCEYHVYEFFKIWNCSRDEADMRVHEFFKTPYFKKGIHPIPGALQALQKLSKFCSFSIVTSRQNVIKDHTIEWIEKHYGGVFQDIHFGNHFALDGQSIPKSEICRSLGASVLIDDNPRYAIECAKVGIQVFLFDYKNSYPWCKTESVKQHPLVTKVHDWTEVEHQLFSWMRS